MGESKGPDQDSAAQLSASEWREVIKEAEEVPSVALAAALGASGALGLSEGARLAAASLAADAFGTRAALLLAGSREDRTSDAMSALEEATGGVGYSSQAMALAAEALNGCGTMASAMRAAGRLPTSDTIAAAAKGLAAVNAPLDDLRREHEEHNARLAQYYADTLTTPETGRPGEIPDTGRVSGELAKLAEMTARFTRQYGTLMKSAEAVREYNVERGWGGSQPALGEPANQTFSFRTTEAERRAIEAHSLPGESRNATARRLLLEAVGCTREIE